jgi:hypothetical protein
MACHTDTVFTKHPILEEYVKNDFKLSNCVIKLQMYAMEFQM